MSLKNDFIDIVSHKIYRSGIKDLMGWLSYTDFYFCPASTRFHGAEKEGLLRHSLNVYHHAYHLRDCFIHYKPVTYISTESLAITALFHDLCKINCYQEQIKFRKNEENEWEKYTAYKFEDKMPIGGHAVKSLFLLQNFMKITQEEAQAIMCHMGAYESTNYTNTATIYTQNPLAWILHVADEADTYGIPIK